VLVKWLRLHVIVHYHEAVSCPSVITKGIAPEKMHSLKAHCQHILFAKSDATVLSPAACSEIDDNNSVVHRIAAHPSCPQIAVRYTAANALASKRSPEPFLLSPFFFFSFFIFLFPVGMCNKIMA